VATTVGGWRSGPEAAADSAGGDPKRGRPTGYAPKIIDMMCDKIRRFGLSDSAAAEHVGMSTSTVSRWKQLYPEIGPKLQQARQEIRIHHLEIIEQAAQAENGRGWRASAWMLERLFPADYARKISERFAALSLDDLLKDREARAALEVQLKELYAMQDAERDAREAAQAAAEAEAQAGEGVEAAGHQAGGPERETPEPQADAPRVYSESASHNSRNSGGGDVPSALHGAASPAALGDDASQFYSEGGSHNSRNSGSAGLPEERHGTPWTPTKGGCSN
jgi:hypothetical protein